MLNKYSPIITQIANDPKYSLSIYANKLLPILEFLWNNREDTFIRLGNDEGSMILGCNPTQISRVVKELHKKGFIQVEYQSDKNGVIRKIRFNEEGGNG